MLNRLWTFFVAICVLVIGLPLAFLIIYIPTLIVIDFGGQLIGSRDVAGWGLVALIILGFAWWASGTYLKTKAKTQYYHDETIRIRAETDAIKKARENR